MKKILILQDLSLNGGTRQALKLFDDKDFDNLKIALLKPNFKNILSSIRFIKNAIIFFIYIKKIININFISHKIKATNKLKVITTSKKTLEFIANIDSQYHIHYCQHIEIWKLYESKLFINFCRQKGYPDGKKLSFLIDQFYLNLSSIDKKYLNNISLIKNFYVVSFFLDEFINSINSNCNIFHQKVYPHINKVNLNLPKEKNSVIFFIRGQKFKGDDLIEKIIFSKRLMNIKKYLVLSFIPKKNYLNKINKISNLSVFVKPSDNQLSKLFSKANLLVNASLSEGFGSLPQEALYYNCNVITSNTGWILNKKQSKRLKIIKKHKVNDYIKEIIKF